MDGLHRDCMVYIASANPPFQSLVVLAFSNLYAGRH